MAERNQGVIAALAGNIGGVRLLQPALLLAIEPTLNHEVSVDHNKAESRAVLIHECLAEQSQWSAKVAEELGDLVAQMVGGESAVRGSEMYGTTVPGNKWSNPGIVSPVKSLPVEVALHDTRSDLEDLRHLARAKDSSVVGTDPRGPISATKRLAARVDTLLEMIEPAEASSSG